MAVSSHNGGHEWPRTNIVVTEPKTGWSQPSLEEVFGFRGFPESQMFSTSTSSILLGQGSGICLPVSAFAFADADPKRAELPLHYVNRHCVLRLIRGENAGGDDTANQHCDTGQTDSQFMPIKLFIFAASLCAMTENHVFTNDQGIRLSQHR